MWQRKVFGRSKPVEKRGSTDEERVASGPKEKKEKSPDNQGYGVGTVVDFDSHRCDLCAVKAWKFFQSDKWDGRNRWYGDDRG